MTTKEGTLATPGQSEWKSFETGVPGGKWLKCRDKNGHEFFCICGYGSMTTSHGKGDSIPEEFRELNANEAAPTKLKNQRPFSF